MSTPAQADRGNGSWKSPESRQRLHDLLGALGKSKITVEQFWQSMGEAGLTDADIDDFCAEEHPYVGPAWDDNLPVDLYPTKVIRFADFPKRLAPFGIHQQPLPNGRTSENEMILSDGKGSELKAHADAVGNLEVVTTAYMKNGHLTNPWGVLSALATEYCSGFERFWARREREAKER